MAATKPLKAIEKRFAAIYVANGNNGTQAYKAIRPRASEASSRVSASEWLSRPNIRAEVDRLTTEALQREHLSANEALAIVARRIKASLADYYWKPGEKDSEGKPTDIGTRKQLHELTPAQAANIRKLKPTQFGVELELRDDDKQLTNVLRHHKLLTDHIDVSGSISLEKLIGGAGEAEGD